MAENDEESSGQYDPSHVYDDEEISGSGDSRTYTLFNVFVM